MLTIGADQFQSMEAEARHAFLLKTVMEWFALFETAYQRPSRITFESAWKTADFVFEHIAQLPRRWSLPIDYTFIHTVLTAIEKGATPAQLRAGLAEFCKALPADEAGLILFESICAVDQLGTP